ncbi:MAG: hypothetical protein NT075_29385, partial [Chloroflexi bacterium]|nr:hypothetical protein [Chloroflexota bacterium]
ITQFKESIIYLKTAYYWRVRGIDAQDNLTPWSDISTFEFDYTTSPNPVYPLPYALPDSITLPVHDDHTVAWPLFIWDTAHAWPQGQSPALARAADYYILTLSTDPSFVITPTFQITTTGLAATPTIENPLVKFADHQLYYWRVRAMRDGQPMGSDTVRLTRIDPTLSKLQETELISPTYPPDGFEAVGDPPVLGWTPVRGADHYKIELSHDRTFSTIDETAYPLFANYVPWQGKLTHLPFGSYWWRVRAESEPNTPLGDWSVAQHFNLSVGIATGNKYDFVPASYPSSLLAVGEPETYSPTLSLVATNPLPAGDQSTVNNLHMLLNRVNLRGSGASNLDWVIAFSTPLTIETALQYGIYIDVDHVENAGATSDPENHQITVDSFYRPEYVIYIDRDPVAALGPQQIRLYKWNGLSWNPAQPLNGIGGDAWYDNATHAVQLVVPYTAIGAGDEDFSGSLALTVFSTKAGGGQPIFDQLPAARNPGNPMLDNPVFVSDMPLPLYPFNTPLFNPTIFYDLPALRWRTPYFDSVDGYQLQVARDAKFTDIVETWEISEQSTAYFFGVLPAAFQSLLAYGDNESYYWRVRIRHERYDANASHFDYSFWSPPMRFKLASRVVGTPSVSTGAQVSTTPVFWWDRVEAAAGYTIQIDNDANFSNPEVNKKIDPNAFTLLDPLADGVWYWRVAIRRSDTVRGAWTPTLSFVKHSLTPNLLSPPDKAIINTQPTFQWTAILTPTVQPRVATPRYQLQIAADPNFSTPKTYETTATSFTLKPVDSLSDGTWYWRVAPIDGKGNVGTYSLGQKFYKEYQQPTLLVPAQGITVTGAISFQWSPLTGTASYEFELDDDPLFNSPLKAKTDNTEYTPIDAIPPKQYYWHVRMVDADRQVGPFRVEVGMFILKANKLFLPVIRKQ